MSISVTNVHIIFAEAGRMPQYRVASSLATPGYVFLTNHGVEGDGAALVVHPFGVTHVEFLLIKLA